MKRSLIAAQRRRTLWRAILLAGTAFAAAPGSALADPQYWDGSHTAPGGGVGGRGGDGYWYANSGAASNFTDATGASNSGWASGDAIFAGSAGTVQVSGLVNFDSAHFEVTGYDVRQDENVFMSQLVIAAGNSTVTTDSGVTTTISAVFNGSSGGALVKNGAGVLILQDNPFGGQNSQSSTLIQGGTLQIESADVLGQDLGSGLSVTISNGATLSYHDLFLSVPSLSDGLSTTFAGAVVLGAGGGVIEVDDASNRPGDPNAATLFLQGGVSGTGGLTKTGTGTLELDGASTYTGATHVLAGALDLRAAGALGSGDLAISAGALVRALVGDMGVATLNGAGAFYFVSSGAQSLTVGGGSFSGLIGELNGATGALVKTGAGALTLSGANSYSGGTSVNGGTLALANNLAAGSGAIALAGGTTLQLVNTGMVVANAITLAGVANLDSGAGTSTLSGAITGSGGFTKLGAGTLILTGANLYAGTTTISAGVLQIGAGGASGTLGAGAVVDNASLVFNRSDDFGVSQVISGTGSLTQAGVGTLRLTGANSYAGGTSVTSGTLALANNLAAGSGAIALADGTNLKLLNTGMVVANAITLAGVAKLDSGAGTSTLSGAITGSGGFAKLGAGTLILTGANLYAGTTTIAAGVLQIGAGGASGTLGSGALVDNASLVFDRSDAVTVAQTIGGTGALTQAGAGTLTLTGANSYAGGTTIAAGGIVAGNATALATGAISMANGTTLGFSTSMTLANALAVSGSTGGALDTGANAVTLSGVVSGAGALAKLGAGTLTLTGANSYAGGTFVEAGALAIASAQALGSGSLSLADATTLDLLSSMVLSNKINLSGLGDPNIDTGASNVTLAGAISGSGSLTKLGTGTLVLTGTDTYAGATLVSAGTLEVDGAIVSSTTVGASGTLSGVGTVGAIAVSSGGVLSPGNAAQPLGTLHATGNVAFASGSTFAVSFGPTGSSLLTTTGAASLAGAVVAAWTGGAPTTGSRYTILTANGGVSGTFGSLTVTGLTTNLPILAYDANVSLCWEASPIASITAAASP